ncbi:MAG: radical SAM family heme chaperone HemW [Fusobacteriota bacterium]
MDSIYIHIPFCKKKCYYCDFLSFEKNEKDISEYINYLIKEINLYNENIYDTIYFGGGTPSLLSVKQIYEVLNNLKWDKNAEITLEVNPTTVDLKKLNRFLEMGINRLSIGFQSFNDKTLKKLGRIHTSREAIDIYKESRKVGFKNISLDLIFATPGQTLKELKNDLENIINLEPEHISIYSLIWKKGSKLWKMKKANEVEEVENDLEAKMYEYIIEFLTKNGYIHYEISNFCKPGYKSRHNTKYWLNREYVGAGLGASGYIGNMRYINDHDITEYKEKINQGKKPIYEKEILSKKDKISYKNMLGLRLLKKGVKVTGKDFIKIADKLCEQGDLLKKGDRYFLSKKGLMFANQVFMEFI